MSDSKFIFELKETVQILCSGEAGQVVGRAEYVAAGRQYLLRYMAANGRANEVWWDELALCYPMDDPLD